MLNRKKILAIVFAFVICISSFAQGSNDAIAENEGIMTSNGKIYVVLAIVLTILTGLIVYITRLDRKISKLEKGDL